jgi:hypothetical protein
MTDKKLSDIRSTNPASPLDGTELVEFTQAGVTVAGTAADLKGAPMGINDQTGSAYTLVRSDAGKDIVCTSSVAVTLTVPPNASVAFPVGTVIHFSQGGTGAVTAAAGTGVTLEALNGFTTTAQNDVRALQQVAIDVWRVL